MGKIFKVGNKPLPLPKRTGKSLTDPTSYNAKAKVARAKLPLSDYQEFRF
jgi:hypothetical protein